MVPTKFAVTVTPGSKWEVFEESGHLPYFEEPEKFVRVVEGFLGGR